MTVLFLNLLNMSLAAALTAGIVMLLRLVLNRRLPRACICILWGVVLIRMAVPAFLPAQFSLFNLITPDAAPAAIESTAVRVELASPYLPVVRMDYLPANMNTVADAVHPITVAAVVWLIGAGILLGLFGVFYLCASRRLRTAVRFPDNTVLNACAQKLGIKRQYPVVQSPLVESPLICGILRPRIILPVGLAESGDIAALELVLTHELAHLRRRDHLLKPLALAVLCLHWFNPVLWLAFFLAVRDFELACDEQVLKVSKEDIRQEYAQTLYDLAVKDTSLSRLGLPAFGESAVKCRVKSIVRYHKPSKWMRLPAAGLIVAVMLVTLSNPTLAVSGAGLPELYNPEILQAQATLGGAPHVHVSLEELPPWVEQAVVAREDRRFREHNGVDWQRTTGAAINLFVPIQGSFTGGSTITQQLVRMATGDTQVTISRKLREINLALQTEQFYSKDEILEAYLNQLYFGNNQYGIGNAALYYFHKPASQLTRSESASLAVIPAFPGQFDPLTHPMENAQARDALLSDML